MKIRIKPKNNVLEILFTCIKEVGATYSYHF